MHTFLKRFTAGLSILAFAVLVNSQVTPARANTVSISPPRFELFGNPGDVVREKLKVSNTGDTTVTYKVGTEDFSASGDDGGIAINESPDAPHTTFSLARWLTVEPSSFTVEPGKEKIIDIVVRIPKNGEPGGHYASVQIKVSGGPTTGGGASVESRLNSLILLRVSGNITEKLSLSTFKASKGYYQKGPVQFNLRTINEGNVHVAPTGTIVITDMFKRKVAEVPLQPANVLPGSARAIATNWEKPGIGRFTATLVANYGSSGKNQPITATANFIVMPMWLVYTIAGTLIFLILLITKRKTFKKILNKLTSD